jgi:stearoyl-CoA desaturase (delta-9 desaturase)
MGAILEEHIFDGQMKSNNDQELALGKIDTINRLTVAEARKEPIVIVWRNVFVFTYLHLAAFYGLYLCFVDVKWATLAWCT